MKNIQATGTVYGNVVTVKQISKAAARKLYIAGQEIYLQSSNMYPFGIWQQLCPIKADADREANDKQFTIIINEYRYYNCDSERGSYVHFYTCIKNPQL